MVAYCATYKNYRETSKRFALQDSAIAKIELETATTSSPPKKKKKRKCGGCKVLF